MVSLRKMRQFQGYVILCILYIILDTITTVVIYFNIYLFILKRILKKHVYYLQFLYLSFRGVSQFDKWETWLSI